MRCRFIEERSGAKRAPKLMKRSKQREVVELATKMIAKIPDEKLPDPVPLDKLSLAIQKSLGASPEQARRALAKAARQARLERLGIKEDSWRNAERRAGFIKGSGPNSTIVLTEAEQAFVKVFAQEYGSKSGVVHAALADLMRKKKWSPPDEEA